MKTLSNISSLPKDVQLYVERPSLSSNAINYASGFIIMALNKIRHELKGYTSARGFDFDDLERVINYDFRIVKRWMDYLEEYEPGSSSLINKNILELGPGADLGIGLITLAEGAKSYHALDVHNLVKNTPYEFYDQLFNRLQADPYLKTEVRELRRQLECFQDKENDRLNYCYRKDFDLSIFKDKKIDLVVSNSAFQQFDDPAKTIAQMSEVTTSGAHFVALIDLKTHTRWIRDRDPLNIYRYPKMIYNFLKFRGSQNRIRPKEFKNILEQNGWIDVKIIPRMQLENSYVSKVNTTLHPKYHTSQSQMEILTCIICAKKA